MGFHPRTWRFAALFVFFVVSFFTFSVYSQTTLKPITVTATRSPQAVTDLISDISILDEETLRRTNAYGVADALRYIGGVQTTSNGAPGAAQSVFIRGANSGHTLTLVEGFRWQSVTVGSTSFHGLPIDQFQRVEILRGPASGLYGADAMGGVVQFFLPRAEREFSAAGSLGLGRYGATAAQGNFAHKNDVVDVAVGLGASRSDGFSSTRLEPDRDGFHRHNLSLNTHWRPFAGQELGLVFLRDDLDMKIDQGSGTDPRNGLITQLIGVHGTHVVNTQWQWGWRVGTTLDEATDNAEGKAVSRQHQASLETSWRFHPSFIFHVGADRLEQTADYADAWGAAYAQSRRTHTLRAALSMNHERHIAQVNVRRDDDTQYGTVTSGGVAYGYRLWPTLPDFRVGGAWSKNFRAPSFNDLYYPGYGRPGVRPEHAHNAELGLYFDREKTSAKMVAFRQSIRNLIVYNAICPDPSAIYAGGCADNVDEALIKGISLAGSTWVGRTEWRATLDLLDPRNVRTDTDLARRARKTATLELNHHVQRWILGVRWQGVGSRYDGEANTANQRLGGYGLLNFHASYPVARGWTWSVRLDNALNKTYEMAQGYNTPGVSLWTSLRYSLR